MDQHLHITPEIRQELDQAVANARPADRITNQDIPANDPVWNRQVYQMLQPPQALQVAGPLAPPPAPQVLLGLFPVAEEAPAAPGA